MITTGQLDVGDGLTGGHAPEGARGDRPTRIIGAAAAVSGSP